MRTLSTLFLFVFIIFFSCNKENDVFIPKVLVSATSIGLQTSFDIKVFIAQSGLNLSTDLAQYNVELYKINYKTSYLGQPITASGLVILPNTTMSLPMVSFQHGTIAAHNEAPSTLSSGDFELVLYAALASPGFITVIPDFIGFGASSDLLHPYYVEDATATPILDMLVAAKELAIQKNISFNGKLFLAGYSQGGYATMATHKAFEKNPLSGFDLVASFPSSGGYDVIGMQEYFFGLTIYNQPFFIAYVADAYKTYYNWPQHLTDFFQPKYATEIPDLFNGTYDGDQINLQLNDTIPRLLNNDLIANINTDAKYKYIVDAFSENSLIDWYPTNKMFMYHGDADVTVPYQNLVDTYNQLIANGALPTVLTFTALPGATHYTGVEPYIESFVPQMMSLK